MPLSASEVKLLPQQRRPVNHTNAKRGHDTWFYLRRREKKSSFLPGSIGIIAISLLAESSPLHSQDGDKQTEGSTLKYVSITSDHNNKVSGLSFLVSACFLCARMSSVWIFKLHITDLIVKICSWTQKKRIWNKIFLRNSKRHTVAENYNIWETKKWGSARFHVTSPNSRRDCKRQK